MDLSITFSSASEPSYHVSMPNVEFANREEFFKQVQNMAWQIWELSHPQERDLRFKELRDKARQFLSQEDYRQIYG